VQTRAQIFNSRITKPSGRRLAGFLRSQAGAELSVEQRGSLLIPLAWFHVPKTGTSICNTLWHTPAVCPGFLADNYISSSGPISGKPTEGWNPSWGVREVVCPGGLSLTYKLLEGGNKAHVGIGGLTGKYYNQNRGHFVTMLRQPEQRLISMYYYFGALGFYGVDNETSRAWVYDTESPSLREYAEWNGGCTVRQLTMDVPFPYATVPLPTSEDVSVAINVLQEGFAFVGITEQWDLSVCLFRAMFGGQCHSSDFLNTRPGDNSSGSDYDTSELNGWVDIWDGPVYSEALLMFESTRNIYGVDSQWCASFCQGQLDFPN